MNEGKRFERDFKASVPRDVYCLRIRDSASFVDFNNGVPETDLRFSTRSPYDFVLCRRGQMYAIEAKSHTGKSMSFAGSNPVIKPHQVEELMKARSGGAVAGLVLEYRDLRETYFITIYQFWMWMNGTEKKSINVADARKIGRRIPQKQQRTHMFYDLTPIWKE